MSIMELVYILFAVITVVLISLLALLVFLFRNLRKIREHQLSSDQADVIRMLNENLQTMHTRIDTTTEAINFRLDKAAQVIGAVNKELGSMSEIGRGLKDFQVFLSSPKLRGNLGEQILYDALDQVFSSSQYSTQFKFKDGQTVDAVIKTNEAMIPIDSKFPMEAFRDMFESADDADKERRKREFIRAVKKHIDDVSKKYILPQEGTVDFAVMYVPSENVYYEIVTNSEEIMDHAKSRNVLLVSPNSFFHFLRVILMGLERAKIQEEAQKIWELLKTLQQDNQKVTESFALVGRHLTNAKNAMDAASNDYGKFCAKLDQVKLLK